MTARIHAAGPLRFAGAVGACALVLASCAPPPPGGLESLEVMAQRGAERRARRAATCEIQSVLRVDGRATGRLPAVTLHMRLTSPDRVRLQIRWLLGLLVDLAVRGDTLTAWMPGERLGLKIAALSDTLGVRDPALFLGRALGATWPVPREAWRRGVADSSGARLGWDERDEHWTLRVDREGRPLEVSVARGERTVTARYSSWHGTGPAAWPARVELADGAGWVRARFELEDVRAARRPRPAWFALVLPEDARRLELDDVKRVLSTRGGLR